MNYLLDRFVGCLVGGAVGDALGYPIEFDGVDEIAQRYGAGPPDRLAAEGALAAASDDTQMTLFSAAALVRANAAGLVDTTRYALEAYQEWLVTQRCPAPSDTGEATTIVDLLADHRVYARRAPGLTCLSELALSIRRTWVQQPTVERPSNDSAGCGAVMRSAPFGLVARSRAEAWMSGRDAAALTHGNPLGYLPAAVFAAVIFDVTRGRSLQSSLERIDRRLGVEPHGGVLLQRTIDSAVQVGLSGRPIEVLGSGWTGDEALAIAIACALRATPTTVDRELWRAVAHPGDSDSTGAIAGNLMGAMFGAASIPARWSAQVDLAPIAELAARDLYTSMARSST